MYSSWCSNPGINNKGRRALYAVKVKRHNVCKRHVAIDTGFKQTERTIFLCVISMGKI